MSRVYHPLRFKDVPASPPHAENTSYRVSIGVEYWDGYPAHVEKVQMVYEGRVSGRRSPSYPVGTDDRKRAIAALDEIRAGGGNSGRGLIQPE